MPTATIFKNGRVTILKALRDAFDLKPGNAVEAKALGPGRILGYKVGATAMRAERLRRPRKVR
jgi:bifunctional DNA-binding transcriptional regulator/antitoxin component of YhaV-PrlF toxin-antitoxin module